MEIVVQIALNAVIAGAIYALIAIGFNIIYSTGKFFDLGYGALIAVGGYLMFYFYKIADFNFFIALLFTIISSSLISYLVSRSVYIPLKEKKASNTVLLVASLGVLTVLQAIIAILFSSQFQTLSKDIASQQTFTIFGGVITETQVYILASGIVISFLLHLLFKYSLFGKAIRAVQDDAQVAEIVGIDSKKIMISMFCLGGAIASLAGLSVGFDSGIEPTMGMNLLLKGVIAVIIGGIGNIFGGVFGAFFLATIENLGAWYFSGEWKDAIAFLVLIIFLLFRPKGIFPKS